MTAQIRELFLQFARTASQQYAAPLYEQLAATIANDDELIAVASDSLLSQPTPQLFLGAVHHVLTSQPDDELASYYSNLQPDATKPAQKAGPALRLLS